MKRIPLEEGSTLAGATVAAPLFDGRTKSAMARAAVKTRPASGKPFRSRPFPEFQLHSSLGRPAQRYHSRCCRGVPAALKPV